MRSLHQVLILAIWCTCFTVIQRTETFLFRRKAYNQLLNDPYQVKPETITTENLFKWLNMKNHIRFKLWTRKNPKWAQEIKIGDMESLYTSNYDFRRLTKVLVHGWAHSANEVYIEDWMFSMRDAYLRLADLNVIFIDYTLFALPFLYWTSAPELAGDRLADFIQFLVKNGAELDHFHMLGYSWGAHVAGIAGYRLNGQVSRITGLDPANPTFRLAEDVHRLDKSDAKFVDIIHTGSGSFLGGHLGLMTPLGHVDYYPNGGTAQPGCAGHWLKIDESIECDHGRSVWYFVESINSPQAFYACRCESWMTYVKGDCSCTDENLTFMGEHSSHATEGKYYLFTKAQRPFGFGPHLNISLQSIDEYDPNWSTYSNVDFNFTKSAAHNYLTEIVQKSLKKIVPSQSNTLQMNNNNNHIVPSKSTVVNTNNNIIVQSFPNFKSDLLNSIRLDDGKFQNAVLRTMRNVARQIPQSDSESTVIHHSVKHLPPLRTSNNPSVIRIE